MSAQTLLPPSDAAAAALGRPVRVEYLDFRNVAEHREYRFRVCGPEGWTESRFRIAIAAFGAGQVRLQDGPDVCYRKLLWTLAGGATSTPDVITIDDADLAGYRELHAPVTKRRSWSPSSPPTPPVSRRPPRTPAPQRAVVAPVPDDREPALEDGQRVSHAVFGAGVTAKSSGGHTVVCFDADGPRTFVTALLKLDVLSARHTWETSPRGINRPCVADLPNDDV
jgi:hypothetical protein